MKYARTDRLIGCIVHFLGLCRAQNFVFSETLGISFITITQTYIYINDGSGGGGNERQQIMPDLIYCCILDVKCYIAILDTIGEIQRLTAALQPKEREMREIK